MHYQKIGQHTFTSGTKFIIFAGREMICPFLSLKRGNNASFLPMQRRQILLKFNAITTKVKKRLLSFTYRIGDFSSQSPKERKQNIAIFM
jgi:hypothetical protein